ncbi:GntR family transcriptional regulator [Pseudoroseomonas rhizosphaerae]|uniref:GntR family transcriptional regulator n=1 Tax=Teichococcus rhizosphaerae TaxID=1335062 RepID=A0A2C7ABY8_9PROT|nr:GntR family transcriptional regulator [Pseudoroseomonas rhizosphaerae]PHK94167.1 GntR family transcriptional regulator [Pseudoroseomonas rhizosphaerae]
MAGFVDTLAEGAPPLTEGALARSLFQRLSEAIIRGEIPLGAKLSEPALSRQYGVSRGPLREALNRLEERRLVERTPRLGARVVSLSAETFRQIYGVREALEGLAARGAALAMGEADLARLRAILARQEASLDAGAGHAPNALGSMDEDFHAAIARAAGNGLLIGLLCGDLYQQLRLYRSQLRKVAGRGRRAVTEHRRILDAIEDRDAEMAEMQMRRHIAASYAALAPLLGPPPANTAPANTAPAPFTPAPAAPSAPEDPSR